MIEVYRGDEKYWECFESLFESAIADGQGLITSNPVHLSGCSFARDNNPIADTYDPSLSLLGKGTVEHPSTDINTKLLQGGAK